MEIGNKEFNVLSLFDGCSGGQQALDRIGKKVDNYYASEIDKYAIQVTIANYPNTIQLGSVTEVDVKVLCLSEVYSYICKNKKYGIDIQSKISEWEMLYWLDKKFTFTANFGTQKQNERHEIQESFILQRFEKIWFSKRGMGSIVRTPKPEGCGEHGNKNDTRESFKLQHSSWRFCNGFYERNKKKNIGWDKRKTEIGGNEEKNIGNIEEKVFLQRGEEINIRKNEISNEKTRSKREFSEWIQEDKYRGEVIEEKGNRGEEESCDIQDFDEKLCKWDEYEGSSEDYRNFLRIHNKTQVTLVENGNGISIFLGLINLCAGGSPCQSFSFAGKRKGMSTKDNIEILTLEHYMELKNQNFEFEGQSYLFWEYIRILTDIRKYNPDVKFLLENVMMGAKWQKVLAQGIGINPIEINSSLVSAQNRRRLYFTNIGAIEDGLFGDLKCMIPQPKDRGILLKDILEPEVDEKYYLSESVTNRFKEQIKGSNVIGTTAPDFRTIGQRDEVYGLEGKMGCLNATDYKQPKQIQTIVHNTMPRSSKTGKGGTGPLSRNDGKTYCLDTGQTNAIQIVAMRGRNPENTSDGTKGCPTKQMLDPREDGKTNCITTVQKDNLVMLNENQKRKFNENPNTDKAGCLTLAQGRAGSSDEYMDSISKIAKIQGKIRRLTPIECERLQQMTDNYTKHVSDSQRYKMIGNGWSIEVISFIFSYLDK